MGTGTRVPCSEDREKWVEKFKIPRGKLILRKRAKKHQQMRDVFATDEIQIVAHFQNDLNIFKILKR